MKKTGKVLTLEQVIFTPARMDGLARAVGAADYSPKVMADDIRAGQLAAYRKAGALLEIAANILSDADVNWACEPSAGRALDKVQAARKELRQTTAHVRGITARLGKMRQWPKMRRTA